MWKYRTLVNLVFVICIDLFLSTIPAQSDGFLSDDDLQLVKFDCLIEGTEIGYCSGKALMGNKVTLKLPLFKSLILSDGTHAFRIMATLENFSRNIVRNARIVASFGDGYGEQLEILITERVKFKGSSTTRKSHLIRSNLPKQRKLYEKLNYIYYEADPSDITLRVTEINFVNN